MIRAGGKRLFYMSNLNLNCCACETKSQHLKAGSEAQDIVMKFHSKTAHSFYEKIDLPGTIIAYKYHGPLLLCRFIPT